jgi:hypothetical protein
VCDILGLDYGSCSLRPFSRVGHEIIRIPIARLNVEQLDSSGPCTDTQGVIKFSHQAGNSRLGLVNPDGNPSNAVAIGRSIPGTEPGLATIRWGLELARSISELLLSGDLYSSTSRYAI